MRPIRFVCLAGLAAAALPVRADDAVNTATRADVAFARYGLTGRGVAVAIIDRGIDYTHPDFRHADGTTRIKWLLDMSGQNLCDPANPQPLEFTEAQINASLISGIPLPTRDAVGHGTVTAGLAAGNGRAAANGRYAGLAPEADLIIIKVTSEGAPAHDTQPAEDPFQGCYDQALDWLDSRITTLGEPCVALIDSGVQWGPMDGTSAVSRKIDQVFGSGRPGRAYIAASGDEGSYPNHAGGAYDGSADTIVRLNKATTDSDYWSIWYTGGEPAQITVTFDDGTTVGPVPAGGFLQQDGVYIVQYDPGQQFYPWTSSGPDRAVWIGIDGHSGGGSVRIRAQQPGAGRFDLYGGGTTITSFTDHLVPGRLTDYSTTLSAIVDGCSVVRTIYTDLDGIQRIINDEGNTGEIWLNSSAGPTRDGRPYGIDVITPGHNSFAAYAQHSYWATFRFNEVQDGNGWYGRHGATSASAPILVGAVALMLQMKPTLTAGEVRSILRATARADSFTGPTPNVTWGAGKLDIAAALDRVLSTCYANCDGSTNPPVLNVNDFICFQSRFAAGSSYANCDGSTQAPVLNVNDFICFQSHFVSGCP